MGLIASAIAKSKVYVIVDPDRSNFKFVFWPKQAQLKMTHFQKIHPPYSWIT
jgi:hypothetical protein